MKFDSKKESKLIFSFLIIMILSLFLASFIEVVEKEEIVLKDEMIIEKLHDYDLLINDKTITMTTRQYDNFYFDEGDKYVVTYKYMRFKDKDKKLVKIEYIY